MEGFSDYYSPHTILRKENIDYKKYSEHEFEMNVQAYEDNDKLKSTNLSRMIHWIYIIPDTHSDGGYEVMDLASGR